MKWRITVGTAVSEVPSLQQVWLMLRGLFDEKKFPVGGKIIIEKIED